MDTVSTAAVRVAVGLDGTEVEVSGSAVGVDVRVIVGSADVGVRVKVEDGGTIAGVSDGPTVGGTDCEAVGVRVSVGDGGATCLISNERTVDQAPFVPLDVRSRTRHQKRRSLFNVWVGWACVSPARARSGLPSLLKSPAMRSPPAVLECGGAGS